MKKNIKLLYLLIIGLSIVTSCENLIDKEKISPIADIIDKNSITDSASNEVIEELQATEELKDQLNKIKFQNNKKRTVQNDDYDENFFMNMYAIRDLPVVFEARGTANTYSKFLSANGAGKEITLISRGAGSNQKFLIKVYPPSTGIPYRIYSNATGTALSIGQYSNNPTKKIVMAKADNTGDMYYANWSFIAATNNPGYFALENQGLFTQGGSGDWGDYFYPVMEVENNDKIGLTRYRSDAKQEFIIQPDAIFSLKDVQFLNPYSATVTQRSNFAMEKAIINSTSQLRNENIELSQTVDEESYFRDKKGIAFRLGSSGLKFARPTVTLGKIDLTANQDIAKDTSYDPNLYKKYTRILSNILPVKVKPRTKLVVTYYYKVFDFEVDFVATIIYSDREAKISGRWSGRRYVDEIFEFDTEEINLDTGVRIRGKLSSKGEFLSSINP